MAKSNALLPKAPNRLSSLGYGIVHEGVRCFVMYMLHVSS